MTQETIAEDGANPFAFGADQDAPSPHVHLIRKGIRCVTDKRGQPTPGGASPFELVVDASEGFIPLWARDTILRWQFAEGALAHFKDPAAAERAIEALLGRAVLAWGVAAPVKFAKRDDAWDFEIVVRRTNDCDGDGCVLASAFFPDAGRHQLVIYPMMFQQKPQEQLETLIHEIGHVFGLRHFFALLKEKGFPAELFGVQDKFSIMNYGDASMLTEADKADLGRLYEAAWNGQLTNINGTPIQFVRPFHEAPAHDRSVAIVARGA